MARVAKVSALSGLTRVEMLSKILEVQPKYDRKANFNRVEKKFQSIINPTKSVKTVKTPRAKSLKPKAPKTVKPSIIQNGKKVTISPLTGLTYAEMKADIKKDNPAYTKRKHSDIENDYIVNNFNKSNSLKPITSTSQLSTPLQALSDTVLNSYRQLRDYGEAEFVVKASKDRLNVIYGAGDRSAFTNSKMAELVRTVMGQYQAYTDQDIKNLVNMISETDYQAKVSDMINAEYDYVQLVIKYFRDKENAQ